MILKHFSEDSLAQFAYLVGCAETGEALVIDPTIDVRQYIDAAEAEGLRITDVAETHIHADFVSGGRALAAATGARLHISGEGGADWQYSFADEPSVNVLHHGDTIAVGNIRLHVVHTPGHTPEHLIFVVTDTRASADPLGAFTGDFLFVGDVGRPDLLETAAGQHGTMEASARRLFRSFDGLKGLPDHLLIWPGHGSGSACGKSLGGVPVSSLGYERRTNWALHERSQDAFAAAVLQDQPDPPMYFGEMKRINREGAEAWSAGRGMPAIDAGEIAILVNAGQLAVDVRADAADGFLPHSIVIPPGRSFSAWAGSVVPAAERFVIVAKDQSGAEEARRALALIGRTAADGWISPAAVAEYREAGGRLERLELATAARDGETVLDVRSTAEWRAGHLPGALHLPLARLPERLGELDRDARLTVYCQSGARSTVAATALRRLGFTSVRSLEGGLSGYRVRTEAAPARVLRS